MAKENSTQKKTRWSEAKAADILAKQRQSGLSVEKYAQREGIDCQRLYRWARRLEPDISVAPFSFVPVSVGAEQSGGASRIEIATRSGNVVSLSDGFNADTLRAVLKVLETSC